MSLPSRSFIVRVTDYLMRHFGPRPEAMCLAPVTASSTGLTVTTPQECGWDGLLWNTPKKRKGIRRQYNTRYGVKEWGGGFMLKENKRIRVDHRTGRYFELGRLSKYSYEKIMKETKEIQEAVTEAFGRFHPKDKEVQLFYEGEDASQKSAKDAMPVEIPKERPAFFSKNLTQKTIVSSESSTNTTVRPSQPLG